MIKLLLNIALGCMATAAFASTQQFAFNWSNLQAQPSPPSLTGTLVPQFNPAFGTLTSISLNLTGTALVGTGNIQNIETYTTTAQVGLSGQHNTLVNNLSILNTSPGLIMSVGVVIAPGATAAVGPASLALGGNASTGDTTGWIGVGSVPILISFDGSFGVFTNPQAKTISDPFLLSTGSGFLTYTYQENSIPEAETYAAGLALVGMVGYGFYRRSRKA